MTQQGQWQPISLPEQDWTAELTSLEAMMTRPTTEGGGLFGIDPIMYTVRRGLIGDGMSKLRAIDKALAELRREKHAGHH